MRTLIIALFMSAVAFSATVYVPDNYPTIQDAVVSAADYDTIIVRDGIYKENIIVYKELTIKSEHGPGYATIHGSYKGSCVSFLGHQQNSSLIGFTIRCGSGTMVYDTCCGGGIYIPNATVKLANNRIIYNECLNGKFNIGGGVYIGLREEESYPCDNGFSALLHDNVIKDNESVQGGGGVYIEFGISKQYSAGRCDIRRNLFDHNRSDFDSALYIFRGRGNLNRNVFQYNMLNDIYAIAPTVNIEYVISAYGEAPARFIISNNVSYWNWGSGFEIDCADKALIVNNLVLENFQHSFGLRNYKTAGLGDFKVVNNIIFSKLNALYTVMQFGDVNVWYHCNDINGGELSIYCLGNSTYQYASDNIDQDPQVDSSFRISKSSPCREAGDNKYAVVSQWDLLGQIRIFNTVDMGPDEWWK